MEDFSDLPTRQHYREYEAVCTFCGWPAKFIQAMSAGWNIGTIIGRSDDPEFNVCKKCGRQCLKITKVPVIENFQQPTGFWKIPEK